mmetsp:Transcript_13496/g.34332  ORF Transcript_13496/g.34332 Transcript_13496/m.34332 type:complete len:252 (+) Transcript_13496:400-1155(+)
MTIYEDGAYNGLEDIGQKLRRNPIWDTLFCGDVQFGLELWNTVLNEVMQLEPLGGNSPKVEIRQSPHLPCSKLACTPIWILPDCITHHNVFDHSIAKKLQALVVKTRDVGWVCLMKNRRMRDCLEQENSITECVAQIFLKLRKFGARRLGVTLWASIVTHSVRTILQKEPLLVHLVITQNRQANAPEKFPCHVLPSHRKIGSQSRFDDVGDDFPTELDILRGPYQRRAPDCLEVLRNNQRMDDVCVKVRFL